MDEREHPRDDNLKLILAEGHEEWLYEKMATTNQRIVVVLAVLAVSLLLLAGTLEFETIGNNLDGLFTELFVIQLLAFAVVPVCAIEAVRNCFVLRRYQASLLDHRDFLRHYNRN
jgi:hypothetical protein